MNKEISMNVHIYMNLNVVHEDLKYILYILCVKIFIFEDHKAV